MKRSFSLAPFSFFCGRPSAGLSSLPRALSRHTSHPTRHSVPRLQVLSLSCHTPRVTRHSLDHLSAFTLIEIMVTIALVAILAGLTMASFGYVNKKAAESKARAEVAALSAAIDRYQADLGSCPSTQADLYKELIGEGTVNTNTLYFEPSDSSRKAETFLDPWGAPYKYNYTNSDELRNVGSFDLWAEPPGAEDEKDWIHN